MSSETIINNPKSHTHKAADIDEEEVYDYMNDIIINLLSFIDGSSFDLVDLNDHLPHQYLVILAFDIILL